MEHKCPFCGSSQVKEDIISGYHLWICTENDCGRYISDDRIIQISLNKPKSE